MFRTKYTRTERLAEALSVLNKHPDKIPVICEPITPSTPPINRSKYLVSGDLTVGQFLHCIRPRICSIRSDQALFLFVGDTRDSIPPTSAIMVNLYDQYRSTDGFLYIGYAIESTFG